MTALLTADWFPYGKNSYFRKTEVYEMNWQHEIDLDNVYIVAAKFGGPIAVIRDRTKLLKTGLKNMGKPIIAIYTASGIPISSFVWNSGQLVQLGWSSTEDLLCVQENGEVIIYSMFGKYVHAFRMGQEVEDTKVIAAQIFSTPSGTGICVLTGAYRLFLTNSIKNPSVRKFAEIPGSMEIPNSWAIISEERHTFILLSKSTDMYYLSESQVIKKNINCGDEERGSIVTDISISPDYQHVALYNSQKQLWIGSSNLRKNYRLYELPGTGRPKQLTWCGSDAVVGYWDETVIVVGRFEDTISYVYEYPVMLISEIDCVRAVSSFSTEIIQPVPQAVIDVFHLTSNSPGSHLLEASEQFQKKNHRANEYIHLVKPHLHTAIDLCIDASSHEFNTVHQKMLMKAAHFGKTFAVDYNPDHYVRMCRILRVLNAVRNPRIGILLTYTQFEHLTLKNLLDRLIARRQYYLAIQAANYMRLDNEEGSTRILEHWAFYKVSQLDADREQVAREISNKLGETSGVSYIDIAKHAEKYGRIKLAVKLIDFEPQAALQVSMLLELKKYTEALEKSVECGNTDLINVVIINMQRNMSMKDFQLEVRKESTVYALYKKQCLERNKEALINIYRQEDDNNEIAACQIKNAYSPENFSTRTTLLESAKEHYKKARNDINLALCDEQKKLLMKQKELEEKLKREFLDLSLHDTVARLLEMKEIKIAEELRYTYRIPDKKFWWLRIENLAKSNEWGELERISKLKKSPIGYEQFIDVCLQQNNITEAKKYIANVKEENKIKYLVKLKLFDQAIRLAESERNLGALEYIKANSETSKDAVSEAIARISSEIR